MDTRDGYDNDGDSSQRMPTLTALLAFQQPGRGSISDGVSAVLLNDSPSSDAPKYSLGFILNELHTPNNQPLQEDEKTSSSYRTRSRAGATPSATSVSTRSSSRSQAKRSATAHPEAISSSAMTEAKAVGTNDRENAAKRKQRVTAKPTAATSMGSEEKRRSRQCKIDGCGNYTINKGLCFRHGGGKKCAVPDCDASSKINGLCWKHGGSIQCTIPGCDRRGKSRGLCWSHGGGTLCQSDDCKKVAVSNGRCWAHGGGKRCLYQNCERPAYARTLNYCPRHFERFEKGEEVMEV